MLLHAVYSVLVDALYIALFFRPQARNRDSGSFEDRRQVRYPVRAEPYPHLVKRFRVPGRGRDPNFNRRRS